MYGSLNKASCTFAKYQAVHKRRLGIVSVLKKLRPEKKDLDRELPFCHTPGRWLTLEQTLPKLHSYRPQQTATAKSKRRYVRILLCLIGLAMYSLRPRKQERQRVLDELQKWLNGNSSSSNTSEIKKSVDNENP